MPDLARDTFTDVAYTVLNAHMEEVNGASWSGLANSNRLLISPGGKVFRSGYNPASGLTDQINGADAFLSYNPPSGDYRIQLLVTWLGSYLSAGGPNGNPADFPDDGAAPGRITALTMIESGDVGFIPGIGGSGLPTGLELINGQYINTTGINNNPGAGNNNRVYLYSRIQGTQTICYTFGYETTGSRYVLCRDQTDIASDGPVYTNWNINTAAPAWADGESRLFELEVNGTTINAYVNGVLVLTAVHADYASGKTGFELKGGSSPVKGFHVDDFKVESLIAPPPPTTIYETLSNRGSEGIELVNNGN